MQERFIESILEVKGLKKNYGDFAAVKGITFDIKEGEIFSLLGGSFERVGIYENDLASLIYAFNPDIEVLLKELSGYLNDSDMVEARQIVRDVEARIRKFRKASE